MKASSPGKHSLINDIAVKGQHPCLQFIFSMVDSKALETPASNYVYTYEPDGTTDKPTQVGTIDLMSQMFQNVSEQRQRYDSFHIHHSKYFLSILTSLLNMGLLKPPLIFE